MFTSVIEKKKKKLGNFPSIFLIKKLNKTGPHYIRPSTTKFTRIPVCCGMYGGVKQKPLAPENMNYGVYMPSMRNSSQYMSLDAQRGTFPFFQ